MTSTVREIHFEIPGDSFGHFMRLRKITGKKYATGIDEP